MATMHPYDAFFSSIWYSTGAVSILFNSLLLFLVIFRSPKSLTPYKIFLGNSAITDLVFSGATTFLQCRLIPNKWAFAYVSLGPASYFGETVSYLTYVVQLHSLFYLFLCFPLSFGFRYYVLIRPSPKPKQVLLLLFIVWLFPLAQLICFVNSQSESSRIREYLAVNKPDYDFDGYVITGNHMVWQPLTAITLGTIVLPMFPIYILVMFFYRRVHAFLDARGSTMASGGRGEGERGDCRHSKRVQREDTRDSSRPSPSRHPSPSSSYSLQSLSMDSTTSSSSTSPSSSTSSTPSSPSSQLPIPSSPSTSSVPTAWPFFVSSTVWQAFPLQTPPPPSPPSPSPRSPLNGRLFASNRDLSSIVKVPLGEEKQCKMYPRDASI